MIDDNEEEEDDEEDDEEEEEEEGEGEGKAGEGNGSQALAGESLIPSPSLEEPHKLRPTTLHLTTLGAQVSFLRHTTVEFGVSVAGPSFSLLMEWSSARPICPYLGLPE